MVRLVDDEAVVVSSSELPSGAARFLPFTSLIGSWMVSGVEVGYVALRALQDH